MRKLVFILQLLFAASVLAQPGGVAIIPVPVAPSGTCPAGLPDQQVISTGTIYTCQNVTAGSGTWGAIGSGGGATIPDTTNLIKGDGAGNGADSGIAPANVPLLNATLNTYTGGALVDGTMTAGRINAGSSTLGGGTLYFWHGPGAGYATIASYQGTISIGGLYGSVLTMNNVAGVGQSSYNEPFTFSSTLSVGAGSAMTSTGPGGALTANAYATAPPADSTITVGSGVAFSANTCSSYTGTGGTASTTTMTGVTTGMTFTHTPTSDVHAVTGWSPASGGQLYFTSWPTSNTLNDYVCNPTASTITTGSSVTFNISAR